MPPALAIPLPAPARHHAAPELVCLMLAVALGHPVGAPAQSPALPGVAFENGFDLTLNGNGPFRFAFNPAAPSALYLDARTAGDLGLPVIAHQRIRILDQARPPTLRVVDVVRIDELKLGGLALHNVTGVATPQDHAAILGLEAFRDNVLTLDYAHDRLSFAPGQLPEADQRRIFHYTGDTVSPELPITLNGIATTAHLEPGARDVGGDIMVPLAFGRTLPLLDGLHEDGVLYNDLGQTFLRWRAVLDGDLQIGATTVHRPSLILSNRLDYINLAGLCSRLLLRYDVSHQRLELHLAEAP